MVQDAAPTNSSPVVIVGGGLAGWTMARELRQRDAGVELVMICADSGDFYSKPMLSNALAAGKEADQIIQAAAAVRAQGLRMRHLGHTRVQSLDRAEHLLQTTSGPVYYGRLVLAIGADAIRLPTPGIEHAISVNDVDDYRNFRAALTAAGPGARVVTIGGGLIGSEFANDLAVAGYRVSIVDPAPWLLGSLVPREQGEALQAALSGLGVQLHLGDVAERIERLPLGGFALPLRSGRTIEADVVLCAVGLRPRTQLAQEAGLATGRGITVDDMGRTSDPDIYALGDCAAYRSAARQEIAEGAPRPLPFVMPIMTAAKAIAATLAGVETPIRFGPMPVRVKTPALPLTVQG